MSTDNGSPIHEKFRNSRSFSKKMANCIFISNFAYFDCKAIKWVMSFKKAFKDLIFLRNPKSPIVMVTSYCYPKFKDFIVCHLKNKCHFTTETVSLLFLKYQKPQYSVFKWYSKVNKIIRIRNKRKQKFQKDQWRDFK